MRETGDLPVVPAASGTPSGAGVPTKFSDLNSYFQALQTRLAVTIASIALLAAAANAVRPLLTDYPLPSGARPIFLWATLSALVVAFFLAAGVLAMPGKLPLLIECRLASRSLASLDEVDPGLHVAFMKEIRRRHYSLHLVHGLIVLGAMWLLFHVVIYHVVVLVGGPLLLDRAPPPPPVDAICAAIGSPTDAAACGFDVIAMVAVAQTGVPVLLGLLVVRWRWWRERRRLAAAVTALAPAAVSAASTPS